MSENIQSKDYNNTWSCHSKFVCGGGSSLLTDSYGNVRVVSILITEDRRGLKPWENLWWAPLIDWLLNSITWTAVLNWARLSRTSISILFLKIYFNYGHQTDFIFTWKYFVEADVSVKWTANLSSDEPGSIHKAQTRNWCGTLFNLLADGFIYWSFSHIMTFRFLECKC
jgi:hypothetical protein